MKRKLLTGILAIMVVIPVTAQQNKNWVLNQSSVVIKGTSSAHDWEMKAQDVHAEFKGVQENDQLQEVEWGQLKIKSNKIMSDNNTMNNKAHEALKYKKHPEISFTANSVKNVSHNGNAFQATVIGNLQLAGKSKTVGIPVKGTYQNENELQLTSKISLNMSDYGIDPPTAMLGALKTGDKVVLEFDLQFIDNSSQSAQK